MKISESQWFWNLPLQRAGGFQCLLTPATNRTATGGQRRGQPGVFLSLFPHAKSLCSPGICLWSLGSYSGLSPLPIGLPSKSPSESCPKSPSPPFPAPSRLPLIQGANFHQRWYNSQKGRSDSSTAKFSAGETKCSSRNRGSFPRARKVNGLK